MGTRIMRSTLLALQVCSDQPDIDKLTEEVNRLDMAGTVSGWQLQLDPKNAKGDSDPTKVACDEKEGHYHYVFTC